MHSLTSFFQGMVKKIFLTENLEMSKFIFYKIVGSSGKDYVLQCINSRATFWADIDDIIFDIDILYGLHPLQACYLGLEYADHHKNKKNIYSDDIEKKLKNYSVNRYGEYNLLYQGRNGEICFIDAINQRTFKMDPRDVALTESLIAKFDAIQSFYIGLLAGLRIENPMSLNKKINHLKVIK